MVSTSRRYRDFPLQIGTEDLDICTAQSIEYCLRRVTIAIPLSARDDCDFRFHSLQEIVGGCISRSVMRNLKDLGLQIQILTDHSMLCLLLCVAGKQH